MKRILFILLSFVCLSSLIASDPAYIYQITGVKIIENSNWVQLENSQNYFLYLRCETGDFDDVTHDHVGGFKTTAECEEFLDYLNTNASTQTPVESWLNKSFILEYK